jgi:hypothetical protein
MAHLIRWRDSRISKQSRYGQTTAQVTSPHFNPVSTNHVMLSWIDAINPDKLWAFCTYFGIKTWCLLQIWDDPASEAVLPSHLESSSPYQVSCFRAIIDDVETCKYYVWSACVSAPTGEVELTAVKLTWSRGNIQTQQYPQGFFRVLPWLMIKPTSWLWWGFWVAELLFLITTWLESELRLIGIVRLNMAESILKPPKF